MKMDRKDELLLLIAVSGEIPSDWIGRAVGSESYAAVLLTRLKREGEVKLRSKDGIRGYLLRNKAKQYLLVHYWDDVRLYLSGANSTNHVKSEPEKRLRLHRMSMVWIYIIGSTPVSYYGTMEWKQETDMEIKGSRACGVLAADQFYVVYNTMGNLMKWTPKIERNLKSRLEIRLRKCRRLLPGGAIIMGVGMEMVQRILISDGGLKGNLFSLDDVYESYYYIPFYAEAAIQLRLLGSESDGVRFYRFLCGALKSVNNDRFSPEAGEDENGTPVYFCYLMDLWQIKRIMSLSIRKGGRIFCFTYQAEVLRLLVPKWFQVEAIRPEKVYRYLGWRQ